LAVADDQFPLAPANGGHGVNGLVAGVHGLIHRLAFDDARGLDFDAAELLGFDRPFAVQGIAHRVDDPADDRLADGHLGDTAGAFDDVALFDMGVFTQDGDPDVVFLQVKGEAVEGPGELQEFHGHAFLHAVDPGDAVAHRQYGAGLCDFHLLFVIPNLGANNLADFFGSNFHLSDLAFY